MFSRDGPGWRSGAGGALPGRACPCRGASVAGDRRSTVEQQWCRAGVIDEPLHVPLGDGDPDRGAQQAAQYEETVQQSSVLRDTWVTRSSFYSRRPRPSMSERISGWQHGGEGERPAEPAAHVDQGTRAVVGAVGQIAHQPSQWRALSGSVGPRRGLLLRCHQIQNHRSAKARDAAAVQVLLTDVGAEEPGQSPWPLVVFRLRTRVFVPYR